MKNLEEKGKQTTELTFVNGNYKVLRFVYRNYLTGNKYLKLN